MASNSLGVLHTDGVPDLVLTTDDALWAGRMCVGEGETTYEGCAAIISTMLRRWASTNQSRLGRGSSVLWPTFTDLLRAYSQPINPAWANSGSASDIARRARVLALSWSEIPSPAQQATVDLLTGALSLTQAGSGAVHFASAAQVSAKLAADSANIRVAAPSANWLHSDSVGRSLDGEPVVTSAGSIAVFDTGGKSEAWKWIVIAGGTALMLGVGYLLLVRWSFR